VFASTTVVARSGAEAVVVDVGVAEVFTLGVHALVGGGFLLCMATLLGFPFLIQSAAA
jgi:hypothetical protein